MEAVLHSPFSFVISGPTGTPATDFAVYLDGTPSLDGGITRIGASNAWIVTLNPNSTGTYSVYCFNEVKAQVTCVSKSLYSSLANLEDEALGSWSWNKQTGALTILRQNGTVLATHTVTDSLTSATRERVS